MVKHQKYLNLAIQKAWKYQGLTYPNPAVGCLILDEFENILSIKAHKKAGYAHAELLAIKDAICKLKPDLILSKDPNKLHEQLINYHDNLLNNATIYVTLEPCSHQGQTPSCAKLIKHIKPKLVVIGQKDENQIAANGANYLQKNGIKVLFLNDTNSHELLLPFLLWQKQNFSFFKLAMSINGVISGGIITSEKSRKKVHKLRSKINLLAIGGNTVRTDKPTLDTRLSGGKNPDVFIYSNQNNFDKNIKLFSIHDRKVFISNDINFIQKYNFCMIEGGENMLKSLPSFVTHVLIFFAPNFIENKNILANLNLKLLFIGKIGNDFYGWFRR